MLSRKYVMLVEDDSTIAALWEYAVQSAGATLLGPFATAEEALSSLSNRRPDAAILDVQLLDGTSFTVAHQLKAQSIPFVFISGTDAQNVPNDLWGSPYMLKPVGVRELISSIKNLLS